MWAFVLKCVYWREVGWEREREGVNCLWKRERVCERERESEAV